MACRRLRGPLPARIELERTVDVERLSPRASAQAHARQAALLLRVSAFDTSTAEGRSRERHRRIALTTVAALGARSIGIVTTLVSVPITIRYLGPERYGLWMTLSALIAMLAFADLGIGNGLLNAVSAAHGNDDRRAAEHLVSSAFFVLLGVALVLAAAFAAAYGSIPWQGVFNVSSSTAVHEAGPAAAVFVGCFLVNLPLGVVQRIQLAYQEGFANSVWVAVGNLLGLAGVVLGVHARAPLQWLVLGMAGGPVVAALANGIMLFGRKRPWLRPSLRRVTQPAAREIARLGALFFVLQLAFVLAYSADNLIAAQVIGPGAVATYAVAMKLFGIGPVVLAMMLLPLWPAYAESIEHGDADWLRATFKRSLWISAGVTVPLAILLVPLGGPILHAWAGAAIDPGVLLLVGLGVWMVLGASGTAVAMLLNGASVVRFQVVSALSMAVLNVALSIVLARWIGLAGVIWGTIIAYTVCELVPQLYVVPRILASLTETRGSHAPAATLGSST
jgi:O-antigen/teichoic acid export membrane protein